MDKTIRIREKTWNADYCGVGYSAMLKAQIYDPRPLSQIALDLEGADQVFFFDGETEREFGGFTRLMRVERVDENAVCFLLDRNNINQEVAS